MEYGYVLLAAKELNTNIPNLVLKKWVSSPFDSTSFNTQSNLLAQPVSESTRVSLEFLV